MNLFPPSFDASTPSTIPVPWDLTSGTDILQVTATDTDVGPNTGIVRYSLLPSSFPLPPNVSDGVDTFWIDPISGQISLQRDLIVELGAHSQFVVTIQASDGGTPPQSASHMLSLTPIPVPMFLPGPTSILVEEELALGTVVSNLTCEEVGIPSNTAMVTLTGTGSQLFRVRGTSGLEIGRRIDYETLPPRERLLTIMANCSNTWGLSSTTQITITITNEDDNRFMFDSSLYIVLVSENASSSEVVRTVRASDRDVPGAVVAYSLLPSNDTSTFAIRSNGDIALISRLDREVQSMYVLTVMATYRINGRLLEGTDTEVRIRVTDINDEAPIFEKSIYMVRNVTTLSEVGDLVVQVMARDADLGSGGQVTYHLRDDGDSEGFELNDTTGEIFVASQLTHGMYILRVEARDGGANPLSSEAMVYVNVLPSPSHLLLTLAENPVHLPEDTRVGSLVTRASSTVIDHSNVTLSTDTTDLVVRFEISNATDPDRFVINADTGEIFILSTLDYETLATEYDIIVRATLTSESLNLTLTDETILRVMVVNLNDNPPRFMPSFYAVTVEQFTPPNRTIITVSAYDPDGNGDAITYSLLGEDRSLFQIEPTSGEVSAVSELETPQDYRFSVVARDSGAEVSTAAVYVAVTRSVSVEPVFTRDEFVFTLSEAARPSTHVGRVSAITTGNRSSEEFGHLGFRIVTSDAMDFDLDNATGGPPMPSNGSLFHIDTESGNISTRALFDIETRRDYMFYVEVYNVNNGTVYGNATVQIRLTDENDNPPEFERSLYTRVINSSLSQGSTLFNLMAVDADSGSNARIRYAFLEPNRTLGFALDAITGAVSVSNTSLVPGDYYLYIEARDGGTPPMMDEATLYVAVLPATPTSIQFTEPAYVFELVEDAEPGALIGVVEARNLSLIPPPGVEYSTSNNSACFHLNPDSGEIHLSCATLDRDTGPTHQFPITASIGEEVAVVAYGSVTITLLDVNDNAPMFSLAVYSSIIDHTHGNTTPVLQVSASDPDAGRNGSVSYELISPLSELEVFRIDPVTGDVFLVRETVNVGDYRLSVQATDDGVPLRMSSTAIVLICVTRAQPQSIRFSNLRFNVTENAPLNTIVGTASLVTGLGSPVDPSEFPDNLQFSIVGGDLSPSELFRVDERTGEVRTGVMPRVLDREAAPAHVIRILANFTRFPDVPVRSAEGVFMVTILDLNDNAPMLMRNYDATIDDSAPSGLVLFNVTAQDPDEGANSEVEFTIDPVPQYLFGVREIESTPPFTQGEIFVNDTISLTPQTYRFTLMAVDRGDPPRRTTAQVDIIVEHAIPQSISFSSPSYEFVVLEEMPQGTLVGNVSIIPQTPALDDLVFDSVGVSGGEDFFTVNPQTGEIRTRHRRIDRETNSSFQLTLRAYLPFQDPPLETEVDVNITVADINDNAPMFTQGVYPGVGVATDQLRTSVPLNTSILATDRDLGLNAEVIYQIDSITMDRILILNTSSFFVLDNRTGEIFPASTDIGVGSYFLNISASDRGMPSLTSYTSVPVLIQRPAPRSISFTNSSGYLFRLQEEQSITDFARVGLEGIPEYLLEFVSYTSSSDDFTVDMHTGEIATTRNFDYELEKRFSFEVTGVLMVTNRVPSISLSTQVTVTVEIVDINDNTPCFVDFPSRIFQYEDRPTRELVHTIRANDSDSGINARLRFDIRNTDIGDLLTIDPDTGEITAAPGLDREDPTQGMTHVIPIQVCDGGMRCTTERTNFSLLDINDNRPRLMSGFSYSVNERVPAGTEVFSFVGADPDLGANGTVRYVLVSTDVPLVCDRITGRVSLTAELDYEMVTLYRVTLRLEDTGDPMLSTLYENVTVEVVNLPDNAPRFGQSTYQGNTPPLVREGVELFRVQATDLDLGDTLRYAITRVQQTGNDGNLPSLRIDRATGQITVSANEEYIPEAVFTVELLVYDSSQFNLTGTTTLNITVVPQPLSFTQDRYTVTVPENRPVRSRLTTLDISALSVSSNIEYSFRVVVPAQTPVPDALETFDISANGAPTVTITLADPGTGLDREAEDRYELEVTASRPGERAQTTLVVVVSDVNDNRPTFMDRNGTVITVSEGVTMSTLITTSNATDLDIDENARLVFSLVDPPNDLPFAIATETGEIRTRGALDYERVQSYNLMVHVRDSGTRRLSSLITYVINILNVNDEFPSFAAMAYFGEVYARAPTGSTVLHTVLRVSDGDDPRHELPLTFTINGVSQQIDEYRFSVRPGGEGGGEYVISVDSLPESADLASQMLEFRLGVTDEGGKEVVVPLYISVFTSQNLASFMVVGVEREEFLSCEERSSSMCVFRQAVAGLVQQELSANERITFFNNTVLTTSPDT